MVHIKGGTYWGRELKCVNWCASTALPTSGREIIRCQSLHQIDEAHAELAAQPPRNSEERAIEPWMAVQLSCDPNSLLVQCC